MQRVSLSLPDHLAELLRKEADLRLRPISNLVALILTERYAKKEKGVPPQDE